jgi:hypothetical protein
MDVYMFLPRYIFDSQTLLSHSKNDIHDTTPPVTLTIEFRIGQHILSMQSNLL